MMLSAVFLLSLSSIAFEILLARVFSISQWNHLSFMVISIALFGFAASGTFLSIIETRKPHLIKSLKAGDASFRLVLMYVFSANAAFFYLNHIPLDYFRLPIEPLQAVYLLTAYLFLALPFFATGLVISIAYVVLHRKTGVVYFATMAGSACGALIPVLILPLMGEGRSVVLSALLPVIHLVAACINGGNGGYGKNSRNRFKKSAAIAVCIGILIAGCNFLWDKDRLHIRVQPSPYKSLSQFRQFPGTRLTHTDHTIRGRIDQVESPYIRFAPGLSLKFKGNLPEQSACFIDGDSQTTFYTPQPGIIDDFSKQTLPYIGYDLAGQPQRVLVVQNGGGSGVRCAIASGAADVTVVEKNPAVARMVRKHYPVTVVTESPRAFLAGVQDRFHVIQIENWGTSIPGSAALGQDFSFTIEAFTQYLDHLTGNGHLVVSRKLLLPPADTIRLFATAYEALRSSGVQNPEHHLAIVRNWDIFTMILSMSELDTVLVTRLARTLNFDIVLLHNIEKHAVNRFHVFDSPFYYNRIRHLLSAYGSGKESTFFEDYLLDVQPQTDSRPFPGRLIKWKKLHHIFKARGSRMYALFMSGEVIVVVVLAEALVISIVLLLLPIVLTRFGDARPPAAQVCYFLSIGAGFMFMELYFIKSYTLLFGDPVISLTVVLSGILVFSGVGGICSQLLDRRNMSYILWALIIFLAIVAFGLNHIMVHILGLPLSVRYLSAYMLLLPAGMLIGLPFPLGMRLLSYTPVERAYAWASNGCASVLAAILSAQVAINVGVPMVAVSGICSYVMALVCCWFMRPQTG